MDCGFGDFVEGKQDTEELDYFQDYECIFVYFKVWFSNDIYVPFLPFNQKNYEFK